MKNSSKISIIDSMLRAVSLLILMFPLCTYSQETVMQSNGVSASIDYFQGLSSKDRKERSEAITKLEKLTDSEKISTLKKVYIDNERLHEKHFNAWGLLYSLKKIGSIKTAALEDDVYRKLDEMLGTTEKNPQTRYEVPGFSDRLKFYIRILPYTGLDGDRSFKILSKHIELHWDVSSEVNDALDTMLLIPYTAHSNQIVELTKVLSYKITDKGRIRYVAALQFIKKTFNRFINKKYKNTVNDILLNHIKDLNAINREKIHPSYQYTVKERVREYEKLIASFNAKYQDEVNDGLTVIAEYNDFDKVLSTLSVDRRVPMFHANIPNNGDDYKSYISGLNDGLFSKAFEEHRLNFRLGLTYRASGYPEDGEILYLLIANKSPKDFIVSANIKFINAQGHIINEVNLTNGYIISNIENAVIGTMLTSANRLAKRLKITLTLNDHSKLQPEVPLFKRMFMGAKETNKNDHVFDEKNFRAENTDFPKKYNDLLERNKSKLVFDESSKRACNDKYNINVRKYSSSKNEDEYLLYSAFCSAWGGECSYGHENQVLYKITKNDTHEEFSEILELNNNGENYSRIGKVYDVNNDGDIELVISENYCLSSSLTIKKLVGNKLIHLISGTEYSEGGYQAEPMHSTNPFVYSQI